MASNEEDVKPRISERLGAVLPTSTTHDLQLSRHPEHEKAIEGQ
jgi:hypothetical protein